jgi:hypothetical protein
MLLQKHDDFHSHYDVNSEKLKFHGGFLPKPIATLNFQYTFQKQNNTMSSNQKQCQKIAKSTGKQCKNNAAEGENCCPSHAEKSLSAPAAPSVVRVRSQPLVAPTKAQPRVKTSARDRAPPPPPKIISKKSQKSQKRTPTIDDEEDDDERHQVEKIVLATCQTISKTSKKRCKNKVSLAGEQNCPLHGGLTKNRAPMKKRRSPVPWALINSGCIGYLLNNHGHCKCLAKPDKCKIIQVIIWFQSLATSVSSRKASSRSTYPSPGVLSKWLDDSPRNMSNELILEKARSLLGIGNVAWLQALIPVKGRSVDVDEDEDEDEDEEDDDVDEVEQAEDRSRAKLQEEQQHASDDEEFVAPKRKPKKNVAKVVPKVAAKAKEKEELEEENDEAENSASAMHISGDDDDAPEIEEEAEDENDNEEEETALKPTSKKTSKRVKMDEDEEDEKDDVKKKHAHDAVTFVTQNSPAL